MARPLPGSPNRALHPDERAMRPQLEAALTRGSAEHYEDAAQYDHEYQRRRDDLAFYLEVASGKTGPRRPPGPILELGCGSGRLTLPLVRAGHTVVGIDTSAPMIARARARLAKLGEAGLRGELHVADFRALAGARSPLGRRRFALIVCPFNAFQHLYDLRDVERFLEGVRDHLAPGGLFVLDLMNPDLGWLSRDPSRRWGRTRYKDPVTGAPMIYSTQIVYDSPLQIAFMTIYYEPVAPKRSDGKKAKKAPRARRSLLTHRHFYPRELEALFHYNGWEIVRRDGDFAGRSLQPESEQQVLWCRPARVSPGTRPRRKTEHSR